jgi:GNAT superfamily N-acetyltransferase
VRSFDDVFWSAHRESARHFDVSDDDVLDELSALEREVLVPAGRRWFVVRDAGGVPVAFAALLVLEDVGFLDHVVTLPTARRRGYATALASRALAEARAAGADRTYLLAEPDAPAAELYARMGFERAGHVASWVSPITR